MQFVSVEQHSIGNILPLWHKKLMCYSQPNVRLNLHSCQMEMEKRFECTGSIKHDQACYHRHYCLNHGGLRGPSFCGGKKQKKKIKIYSNDCDLMKHRRSNFLSSYWSARWTETQWLIRRRDDLISTFDTAGKRKLKPQKAKHTSHPSFPQECGCITLKHPAGHTINRPLS